MADQLRVEIFDLVRRVVQICFLHFGRRTLHEENMVICVLVAAVQMHESHDIDVRKIPMVENIGRDEVEVVRVPLELRIEFSMNISEVA